MALPLNDAEEIRARLEHQVDLVIDAGPCGVEVTTVVDLSGERRGWCARARATSAPFGFVKEALH